MRKRSYKITASLKEGYTSQGRMHSYGDAEHVAEKWMTERLHSGLPVVSGMLQAGTLIFPNPKHSTGIQVAAEPCVIYAGELSSPEDARRPSSEVSRTLESLAKRLKDELGQEEVFIVYGGRNWSV